MLMPAWFAHGVQDYWAAMFDLSWDNNTHVVFSQYVFSPWTNSQVGHTTLLHPSSDSLQVDSATVTSFAWGLGFSFCFLLCRCSIVKVIMGESIALSFPSG